MGCTYNMARLAPFEVDMEGSQFYMGVCNFRPQEYDSIRKLVAWLGLHHTPIIALQTGYVVSYSASELQSVISTHYTHKKKLSLGKKSQDCYDCPATVISRCGEGTPNHEQDYRVSFIQVQSPHDKYFLI